MQKQNFARQNVIHPQGRRRRDRNGAESKRANALWMGGKLDDREVNVTLDAATGKKACKNVSGTKNKIRSDSENAAEWTEYLEKAKPGSVVLVHNHTNATPISATDIKTLLEYKSVKAVVAVDKYGNLYLIEKGTGAVYNVSEVIGEYKEIEEEWKDRLLIINKGGDVVISNPEELIRTLYVELLQILSNKYKLKWGAW